MNTIIKREDMDRGEVDFSDVASGRQLSLVHPGEILRDEFLTPMELSVYRLAQAIKVSRPRMNDIVLDAAVSRPTLHCAWDAILGRRLNSGSISRPVMISTSPNAPCAPRSNRRSSRASRDVSITAERCTRRDFASADDCGRRPQARPRQADEGFRIRRV